MNRKLIVSAFSLIISALSIQAQEDKLAKTLPLLESNNQKSEDSTRVSYKIDPMVERYLEFTDSIDQAKLKNSGYRIQIISFSGPGAKENATKSQTDFLKLYDKTSSYTKWDYPNWVVRVGDFRTKLEALEFHLRIRELYPASYIVTDEINVKY